MKQVSSHIHLLTFSTLWILATDNSINGCLACHLKQNGCGLIVVNLSCSNRGFIDALQCSSYSCFWRLCFCQLNLTVVPPRPKVTVDH